MFSLRPGRVAQSAGHLTHKSGVLGSIPSLATYFCFSFCFFKKGSSKSSYQLLKQIRHTPKKSKSSKTVIHRNSKTEYIRSGCFIRHACITS